MGRRHQGARARRHLDLRWWPLPRRRGAALGGRRRRQGRAALGRHRSGRAGQQVGELHVELPEFHPAVRAACRGRDEDPEALRIRSRARLLHRPHHLVRRQGRGRAVGGALSQDHPRRRHLRTAVSAMRPSRRRFLFLSAGAAALSAIARRASAQAYPSRPIRLILGFAAGGSADIVARLIAQFVSERIGQPVIVENRTGASSNLAGEAVARSAPDGYTLLFVTTVNAINATFFDNLKFDLKRDFAPVSGVTRVPNVLEVNPSVPANNVAEFIAYAKANPGKLNMASTGNGTSIHLAGELFKAMTGTNLVHVPYRSPPQAMTDLLAGQVQVMFDVMTQGLQHIKEGRLRALAVTTAARSDALPDVPTVAETVPGYEASSWSGVCAPSGTPTGIVEMLKKEINAALTDPTIKARLASIGSTAITGSPAEFATFLTEETDKWGKVVRAANIKAE